jgi:hypothetical protein
VSLHGKDLGKLSYFLGIEVTQQDNGISLTRSKYASNLLRWVNMHTCKANTTPMSIEDKLNRAGGKLLTDVEAFNYRSTSALLYFNMR